MRHTALLVAIGLMVGVSPAWAQDPEKPVTVQIDGGYNGLGSKDFSLPVSSIPGAQGVNIAATDAASVFLEFRYHYIWGPEIASSNVPTQPIAGVTPPTGLKANGQFLPITIGVRF